MYFEQIELDWALPDLETPSPKSPRGYQQKAIDSVMELIEQGVRRMVLVMPTGGGKSFVISQVLKRLNSVPRDSIVLVPRLKLKKQMKAEMTASALSPRMVKTAQSVRTQGKSSSLPPSLRYIILDECHEIAWWSQVEQLVAAHPHAVVIGLTATPDRTSKAQFIHDKFDRVISTDTFGDLVAQGYLCNPVYYAYGAQPEITGVNFDYDGLEGLLAQQYLDKQCEKKNFNESVALNMKKHGLENRRSLVFCSSIAQSKDLTSRLKEVGIEAEHVDGSMREGEQEDAIERLSSGAINALCCAKLLIAGFDEPRIDTIVLATATNSRQNLVQMVGRGSRLHPEKSGVYWVFDFGDNFSRLGMGMKQRFPYKTREGDPVPRDAPSKICPECDHRVYSFVMCCPHCGHLFAPKQKPEQDVRELDVVEIEADTSDLEHIKNIRKLVRNCFAKNELFLPLLSNYLDKHGIPFIGTVMPKGGWDLCVFSKRSIRGLADTMNYCDGHIERLMKQMLTKEEKKCIDIKGADVVGEWIFLLSEFTQLSMGKKFLASKEARYYLPTLKWQDALGVLDFASKKDIDDAYRRAWNSIDRQLAHYISINGLGSDPDVDAAQLLASSDPCPVIQDLINRISILNWAYKRGCAVWDETPI